MSLTPLHVAQEALLASVTPLTPVSVPVLEAHGRIVAEEVRAHRPLPACDVSAMDGYAVHAGDTVGVNRNHPGRVRVVDTLYAGHPARRRIERGEAARIFTGAPLPPGADAVVRQEAARAEADSDLAALFIEVSPGKDVRRTGEELATGSLLARRGERIDSARLALLASQGLRTVRVHPAPRVAVLATGDELVPPGGFAAPHQVYESNLALVAGRVMDTGAKVRSLERARDDEPSLLAALSPWLSHPDEVDLLVTTGGASVGERDRVKRALAGLGARFIFDGVALKPGKPVAMARLNRLFILVLPGNPGAAATAFDQFGRALLWALQGRIEARRRIQVRLSESRRKQAGFTYLVSARLLPPSSSNPEDTLPRAEVRPRTGQLLHLLEAEGLVILPPGRAEFEEGERVDMELFAQPDFLPWEPRG